MQLALFDFNQTSFEERGRQRVASSTRRYDDAIITINYEITKLSVV